MKNVKAFILILMPLMISAQADAKKASTKSAKKAAISAPVTPAVAKTEAVTASLSVKEWENNLKSDLAAGKTDLTVHFAFSALEKTYLSHAETADRKNMQAARDLYAKGKFDSAIKKYELIEKGSDYWLEAVEEKAWAYHLQNNHEKALAQTKTLLAEPLVQVVGSEPFFLQSLSNLKICDYPGIFATHQTFKDSQRARISALETLANTGASPAMNAVIEKVESFPVTFTQVGAEAKELPRLFYRDLDYQKRLLQAKLADRGIALIQERMDSAPEADKAKLQKSVDLLSKSKVSALAKMKDRLQVLAKSEDKVNQLMLQKLGLIEIETIQRMHADKNMDPNEFSSGKFSDVTMDDLVFPDDGKPWIDELDKYEVSANACPRNVRRKM